jgi:hypothetical protein
MSSIKDTPLAQSADGGQVVTALRSSKDPALIPFFKKIHNSSVVDNQIFGMIAIATITKDSKQVDLKLLLSSKDQALIGSAIASLIDADILDNDQLLYLEKQAPDGSHRAMAAGELDRRKKLTDRTELKNLLKDDKDIIRYYAATTELNSGDPADVTEALSILKDLSAKHDLRHAPVQALMLVRLQKENLTAGIPWAIQLASDDQADEGLRYTAVTTVLFFKSPEGSRILADMIEKQHETLQQVKLGLISIEFADQLRPAMLEPLIKARSTLAKTIGTIAQQGARHEDNLSALVSLLKEGHPIVLDWALAYADRTDGERRLKLRTTLVEEATIVDNVRDHDYERAAAAATKILDEDGAAGREVIKNLLKSDNRAAVEATLAGIYRSKADNQSELVLPIWDGLTKSTSSESAANYAALILAREGHREALSWLPGMVIGGTVQGPGFRALAGWYYAKLQGQTAELIRVATAD